MQAGMTLDDRKSNVLEEKQYGEKNMLQLLEVILYKENTNTLAIVIECFKDMVLDMSLLLEPLKLS